MIPNTMQKRFSVILPALFLILLASTTVTAQVTGRSITDVSVEKSEEAVSIIIDGSRGLKLTTPQFLDNPPRLVYDFTGTILEFNKGRTLHLNVNQGNLKSVAVSQFQLNPDIARIVLYFSSGNNQSLIGSIHAGQNDNQITLTLGSDNLKTDSPAKETGIKGTIYSLLHQKMEPVGDVFLLKCTESLDEPSIRITEKGATLTFHNVKFQIPVSKRNYFHIPIDGKLINEAEIVNQTSSATLFIATNPALRPLTLDYKINRISEKELAVEWRELTTPLPVETVPEPLEVKSEQGDVTGLVKVLSSSMDDNEKTSTTTTKITSIKYKPLSMGERLVIEAQGKFEPNFSRTKYPERLIMTCENATVFLPQEAVDRYQVNINGAMAKLMKVYYSETDGVPVSTFHFYFDLAENEDIEYNLYSTNKDDTYFLDIIPVASIQDGTVHQVEPDHKLNVQDDPSFRISHEENVKSSDKIDNNRQIVEFKDLDEKNDSQIVQIPSAPDKHVDDATENRNDTDTKSRTEKKANNKSSEKVKPLQLPSNSKTYYRVIVGLYYSESSAQDTVKSLSNDGFNSIIHILKSDKKIYRVQAGAFSSKENADTLAGQIKKKGYTVQVIKE